MNQIEIKFRAWDSRFEAMHYNIEMKGELAPHFIRLHTVPQNECILLQYTGLKDKKGKGKECYHKDLIEYDYDNANDPSGNRCPTNKGKVIGIVEWLEDGWAIVDKNKEYVCGLWHCIINCRGKVIGNIWENPKLFKEKKK